MINIIKEKECTKCNEILPFSSFPKVKTNRDGHDNTCKKCRNEARKRFVIECVICEKGHRTANKKTRYCSRICEGVDKRRRVIVSCSYCSKDIEKLRSQTDRKNHYCDYDCRDEHLKTLLKGKGNPNYNSIDKPCDGCLKEISVRPNRMENYEYHFCSYECYQANVGRFYKGENHPRWDNTITKKERETRRNYPEYYKWRTDVFERDNYTCQCCGDSTGGNLVAHHILNYSEHEELRTELSNGVTLCDIKCHKSFHDTYGYTNNNKEQLNEFMSSIQLDVVFSC